jgi:hypothetical protein
MCADGSHETTREPTGKLITSCTECAIAIPARCVSWTPFGWPVVPEV